MKLLEHTKYPEPPLQEPGSKDCSFFCAAYIGQILGLQVDWRDVKSRRETERKLPELYVRDVHGIEPAWSLYGDDLIEKAKISGSWHPDFKRWIIEHCSKGEVGFASIFLVETIGHSVALLEADEDGVLLADSIRGLVRDSWDVFFNPPGNNATRVDVWYAKHPDLLREQVAE